MIRSTLTEASTNLQALIDAALKGEEVFLVLSDSDRERVIRLFAFDVNPEVAKRRPGSAKGLIWMADDFDEPPEEFEEYMR